MTLTRLRSRAGKIFGALAILVALVPTAGFGQFVIIDQQSVLPTAHGITMRGSTWYVAASFFDPGRIRTYDQDFDLLETISLDNTSDTRGLTYSFATDSFFVTDVDLDKMFEYTISGGSALLKQEWATSAGSPNAVAYDPTDATLWIAYGNGDVEHRTRAGALLDSFAFDESWTGLSVDPATNTLILLESSDTVWEVQKDGSGLTQVIFFDLTPSNGQGIFRDNSSGLLYITDITGGIIVLQDPQRGSCVYEGVDLLISQGQPFVGGVEAYYGGAEWPELKALLDGKADSVAVTPALDDLGFMLQFDSLWVDQRGTDSDPGSFLTATEQSNIQTFFQAGKRVVMFGENSNWSNWNDQILGLVGSSYSGASFDGLTSPSVNHPLATGVGEVDVVVGGLAVGGTPLFDDNFATLHGTSVLTILEVSSQSSQSWTNADNARFFSNVADWAACSEFPLFGDGFESGDVSAWSSSAP